MAAFPSPKAGPRSDKPRSLWRRLVNWQYSHAVAGPRTGDPLLQWFAGDGTSMGRESRQARRQRQRREAERAKKHQSSSSRTGLYAAAGIAVVVIGIIAALVLSQGKGQSATAKATATAAAELTPVPGIAYGPVRCSYQE